MAEPDGGCHVHRPSNGAVPRGAPSPPIPRRDARECLGVATLDAFNLVRTTAENAKSSRKGRLSRDQVDLLRAAIDFTGGGLDAVCQRLVCRASRVAQMSATELRSSSASRTPCFARIDSTPLMLSLLPATISSTAWITRTSAEPARLESIGHRNGLSAHATACCCFSRISSLPRRPS